jgi:flagellin-like hook-associated protein FlgL
VNPGLSPRRESDQLLQRIRTLVRESERDNGRSGVELEAQRREIDRLKSELADLVKQTEKDGQ